MLSQTCDMSQQERPMSLVFLGQKVTTVQRKISLKLALNLFSLHFQQSVKSVILFFLLELKGR